MWKGFHPKTRTFKYQSSAQGPLSDSTLEAEKRKWGTLVPVVCKRKWKFFSKEKERKFDLWHIREFVLYVCQFEKPFYAFWKSSWKNYVSPLLRKPNTFFSLGFKQFFFWDTWTQKIKKWFKLERSPLQWNIHIPSKHNRISIFINKVANIWLKTLLWKICKMFHFTNIKYLATLNLWCNFVVWLIS